ncbi:MAG TPA: DNA-directed RNA polymerase subunit beta [Candidatus Fermentibacter daniensis]|nr:DNA-directed RNA polymerase subunit beta [Candidatus Fermentibacter daniensis]HOF66615.1 DNA-directed RNA polymerase subunit beta [Candidatus Fermentibacter daniensis]HOR07701.1 DNA-directed RNA polymerase subunit beta [Candidatus Fermentibacter daniensis]HOZ17464.1 DNA-directed RNA polymerase subunit beta [Candidatus Fermentibacter daniensis]HPH39034.1 DNA-directed RNA polymerase subunit beta [Candidatus Fermentibacter daniensis]
MNPKRQIRDFSRAIPAIEMPDLLEIQKKSFDMFLQADVPPDDRLPQGLHKIFLDTFPIESSNKEFSLEYVEYTVGTPRWSIQEALDKHLTYSAPLNAKLRLVFRGTPEEKKVSRIVQQSVFHGELPLMTETGSFIINGAERVIVSQLHRSPGVFFEEKTVQRGRRVCSARVIPQRGSWLDLMLDTNDVIFANIDKRPKRIPITMLLRALGLSTDAEILSRFYPKVEKDLEAALKNRGRAVDLTLKSFADDIVDPETGELLATVDEPVETIEKIENLVARGIRKTSFLEIRSEKTDFDGIRKTLAKEESSLGTGQEKNEDNATLWIYEALRGTEAPSLDHAKSYLRSMFFDSKRYSLSEVGRYKLNERLNIDTTMDRLTLSVDDLVAIVDNLIKLREGKITADDIDHLGNRRVKTVGELLGQEFSKGLSRMARTIRDRMGHQDRDKLTPTELVNSRTLSSVINTFFGSSQLSQFMEQTNPLAELTHKRRTSALGEGGLTRERAGFDVRDVHHTHYGRVCPVETPEGPNIGLITTLAVYASINRFGFLEAPYRRVINGRVTNEIVYLSADREDRTTIAEANTHVDRKGNLQGPLVRARRAGNFPMVPPSEVEFIDVSPQQLVGVSAALIPFLEHDDANRALMGSNMQRQAVPLLYTEAPVVGTGLEGRAAKDSGALVSARRGGTVTYADSAMIIVRADSDPLDFNRYDTYKLKKFVRTNQDTSINQKPLVHEGEIVAAGQPLADGMATSQGRLALGVNAIVALCPWNGYNFEDAVVVSERLIKKDIFTSVHVFELETQFRETKLGPEELTREIPNVGEDAKRNLDADGIIRVGSRVKADDYLVGKVTPKGEQDQSPEERLIRAIFGQKAGDVKDVSLKAPTGMDGVVIDVKVYARRDKSERARRELEDKLQKLSAAHDLKKSKLCEERDSILKELLKDHKAVDMIDTLTGEVEVPAGRKLTSTVLNKINFMELDYGRQIVDNLETDDKARQVLRRSALVLDRMQREYEIEIDKLNRGDDLQPGTLKLVKVLIASRRKLQVGDKMAGRHGNKGVVSIIVPEEDMPYLPDGTPVDICINPLGVPSRMNVGQILEMNLGWAADKLGFDAVTPVFDSAKSPEIRKLLSEAGLPESGKSILYDGRTGEAMASPVTVGVMYMMKLAHQVEDKMHARSTGPYAMVTQQPLGGKAQKGGQRLGEMEVWALEAYGAAYTLREMLTIKSDDAEGRSRAYSAIVNNENIPDPGVPESFNVLLNEMRSLALDVELVTEEEK